MKSNISKPDQIYVNGILLNYSDYYVYNLINDINNITIIWNNTIKDCNSMFYNLKNIINLDFSNFDTSEVTSMNCMFGFR